MRAAALACVLVLCVGGVALARATPPADMVAVQGGRFTPFYVTRKAGAPTAAVEVAPFYIERTAVTNRQFLEFVKACPAWRRSRVKRVFAEPGYLSSWRGDLDVDPQQLDAPVTSVSWFAARAYAAWRGRRLPTQVEWEYVAAASETRPDARRDPRFRKRILDWYAHRAPRLPAVRSTFKNVYGAWDMHGLIWEWVDDFNSLLMTGESRQDAGLDRSLFCAAGVLASSDAADYAAYMRHALRFSLQARFTLADLGFRCAMTPPMKP